MGKRKVKGLVLISLVLCLAVFGVVLLSGCWIQEEYNKAYISFYEQYIAGFNTVYANSETQQRQITDNLEEMLLSVQYGMLYNYGNGDNSREKYAHGEVFPDSIRMLVYEDSSGYAKIADKTKQTLTPVENTTDMAKFLSWNWSFDPNLDKSFLSNIANYTTKTVGGIVKPQEYEDWKNDVINPDNEFFGIDYAFPRYMQAVMQIALYEILLGYEPIKLDVTYEVGYTYRIPGTSTDITDNSYYSYSVKVKNCSRASINGEILCEVNPALNLTIGGEVINIPEKNFEVTETDTENPVMVYFGDLQKEYKNTTLYTGLTKQNADILINYILKEIIGEEAVNYDYKNFKNSAVNFRDYVSTIAYLIYSQSYDGSGDTWTYNYTSSKDSSVKISYTFSVGERARAMEAELMEETAMDESWFDYNSSNPENSKIYTEVQAGFSARPATFVRYYEGEKLFGDFDAVDQFSGKPYAEYQSIVVDPKVSEETLPSQGLELECGFCFNFMSKNKDLKIATKIRYYIYDEETGTGKLYEFDGDTIDFVSGANTFKNSAGETCYENDFEFSIDTAELEKLDPTLVRHEVQDNDPNACYYTVPFFKNSEIIQKAKESELSLSSEDASKIARLYKVIESEKGYGGLTVLDEKKVKSSFFEMVLDVIKSPEDENTDYNFSLVVSGTHISPGIW